jgi:uncharacterized protein (DUF1697 family)
VTSYVALLRGINVGAHKRIAMADLRAVLTDLGYEDVRTLLQSGNAVFTGGRATADKVARTVEDAVSRTFGMDVPVLVRTGAELTKVVRDNPFTEVADQGSRLVVSFLSAPPSRAVLGGFDAAAYEPELMYLAGREMYLWLPAGLIESKLMKALPEKRLGVTATVRNWNTVTKLAEMAGG